MHLLILVFLLATGESDAVFRQKLTCPYEAKQQSLRRVWCRRSSPECCTGFHFSHSARSADGGKLRVTQDERSFTVEVLEPGGRDGLYWCGLLSKNATIIKLAEGYFHSSSGAFIWSFLRWAMLPLLPVVTICAYVLTKMKTKKSCKKGDEPYDDIAAAGVLTDPVYDSPGPPTERESAGI